MTRKGINGFLLALLLISAIAGWAIQRDVSEPNYLFIMDEMVHSVPYDAFAANPIFPDGKTLQEPVDGTIAREDPLPLYYQATPEDALRAGVELKNPFTADDEAALKRGARNYKVFCLPCHGPTGRGDGAVAAPGRMPPMPLFSEKAMEMKDGQIFHLLSYGQGNMPSYATQLSQPDRWKTILHVRGLQAKEAAALKKQATKAAQPDAENVEGQS
ncbi:MAG: cytochrome c [Candidatus Hydrogenedentes bacterium]|nr:cytochrome c [Candidatus Hydrogenedentota bacterium]